MEEKERNWRLGEMSLGIQMNHERQVFEELGNRQRAQIRQLKCVIENLKLSIQNLKRQIRNPKNQKR